MSKTLGEELDEIFAPAPETVVQDPGVADVDDVATVSHDPGTCDIHGLELVDARRLGIRHWGAEHPVCCPSTEHTDMDRDRCRWCGGPLVPPGTPRWNVSDAKEYCIPNHRLKAFRARARAVSGGK